MKEQHQLIQEDVTHPVLHVEDVELVHPTLHLPASKHHHTVGIHLCKGECCTGRWAAPSGLW